MINDRRVCVIFASESSGSGLLISDRLVLTADHVLIGDGIQARFPEGGFECEVHWRSAELDVAVLRITDETWMSPDLPELRWGRLVTGPAGLVAEVVGFPEARGAEEACASVVLNHDLDLSGSGRLDLQVGSWSRPPDRSSWRGMSGAAVFAEGLLVGVVVEDPPESASRRLGAVGVEVLCGDPDFRAAVAMPALEPVELAGLQTRPVPVRVSPVGLLRAEAEVVPFHGRDDVLARLAAWRDGSRAGDHGVRVLTGPGGQGKTRVARQFAQAARDAGWLVLEVRADAPAALFDRLAEVRERLLVVVDEAEKQRDRLVRLAAALPGRVRLLLVARTGGAWLRELAVQSEPFAAMLPPTWADDDLAEVIEELGPLQGDPRTVFRAALKAFAARLGVTVPPIRTPRLTEDRYRNVLAVHLEAMAQLIGVTDPADGPDAVSVVLGHEARYWSRQARTKYGLGDLPAPALRQAVAVATLCTVRRCPGESLVDLLAQIPLLAAQPPATRAAVAEWLTDLYGEPGWECAAMRPDPVHEHVIGAALADHPAMLDGVAPELTERQAGEMLTVLARAGAPVSAGRRRDYRVVVAVAAVIDSLIRRFPHRMAFAAWSAAAVVEAAAAAPLQAALDAVEPVQPAGSVFRPIAEGWGTRARPGFFGRVAAAWSGRSIVQRHPDLARTIGTGIAVVALASPLLLLVPESEAGQQVTAGAPPVPAPAVAEPTAAIGDPATVPSPPVLRSAVPTRSMSPGVVAAATSTPARPRAVPPPVVTSRPVPPRVVPSASAAPARPAPPPAVGRIARAAPAPADGRFPVEVDAAGLTASTIKIRGQEQERTEGTVQRFRLAPGKYQLAAPVPSSSARFTVTSAGKIVVGPDATSLRVHNGERLEVRGVDVVIDPTRLDLSATFGIEGVATGLPGAEVHTVRVLPARYRITVGDRRTDAEFTVTPAGTIDYDDGASYLAGRNKRHLRLTGIQVIVDAREMKSSTFVIEDVTTAPRSTSEPRSFALLPVSGSAFYRLHDGRDQAHTGFTVTRNGVVDYPTADADRLAGAGTSTLTVRGTALRGSPGE